MSDKLFKESVGQEAVSRLGSALGAQFPDLSLEEFSAAGIEGLAELELKDRIRHLVGVMTRFLPDDYPRALEIVRLAGSQWEKGDSDDPLSAFAVWPLIDWVGARGLGHPDLSLTALRQLTSLFSAEFAIRPFLLEHTKSTLSELHTWVTDPDEHVRRLVSEGTRPRLPWGQQLPMFRENPDPVLELLEKLKDDESEYVRRSVANNLNDIAKDHPDLAAKVGSRWMKAAPVPRQKLVKHGLRTLIKLGHPEALGAMGYEVDPSVDLDFSINAPKLAMGEYLILNAEIKSTSSKPQNLVVDYAVHFLKANGKQSPKIFKWKVLALMPGQVVSLQKKQKLVSRSVRKLYTGQHGVEILVAGRGYANCAFELMQSAGN